MKVVILAGGLGTRLPETTHVQPKPILWHIMFGFLFTMLGVVAEYIGLICDDVKQRPNYIVRGSVGL